MRYFFVDPEDILGEKAVIRGEQARHMLNVLRMESGEPLLCGDGRGQLYKARVAELGKNEVWLTIEGKGVIDAEPRHDVVLLQGLPKANKLDYVIQKATEVGLLHAWTALPPP